MIARQPKVVPYPMWYNTVPPFIPMDPNMYSMYYSIIKGLDPLISERKERYVTGITQVKLVPPIEQLEQIQYLVRIPTSRLDQPILISKGVFVRQIMAATLPVNIPIANLLLVHGNNVSF